MNGQERVNRMFARQDHDRVPRFEQLWKETLVRWQGEDFEGDLNDFLDLLDSDFHRLSMNWPAIYSGASSVIEKDDFHKGEYLVIEEDDETHVLRDPFGATVRLWKNKSGTPEHLGFECKTPEVWYQRFKPKLIENGNQMNLEKIKEDYAIGRRAGRWCFLAGVETFEFLRAIIGDEVGLMAMIEEPEWIQDISRTFTDMLLMNFEAGLEIGIEPDGLWIFGDMAYNHSTVCSPKMYRELIWPDHKRLVDWAHEHGMKFIYHTDGNINNVLDLYVEAGFDCLQPLEAKAGMDVRKLCPIYGDRLAFLGNINAQLMATNDVDALEEEIATKFAAGKAAQNYAFHSDHSVPPQVSWQTYQEIIRLVDKYGSY